jgi:ankyrin repeat protein
LNLKLAQNYSCPFFARTSRDINNTRKGVCRNSYSHMEELNFSQSLDRFKESFLWAAAQGGNTEDCESLLGIGADINWKHQDGDTALLAACRRGHTHTVESLVAHGADINLTGADSLSPLHICCLRGDFPTLNILLNANPNLSLKTKDGKTAMQLAEAKGHENICSRLNSLISSHSSGGNSSSRSSSSRSTRHNGKRNQPMALNRL